MALDELVHHSTMGMPLPKDENHPEKPPSQNGRQGTIQSKEGCHDKEL